MPLTLTRVVIRGPRMTPGSDTFGGVVYLRERAEQSGIYLSLQTDRRRERFGWPRPDDSKMQVTALQPPFSKSVGVEFCTGTAIETFVDAASEAGENGALCVQAVAPLLDYFQQTHTLT